MPVNLPTGRLRTARIAVTALAVIIPAVVALSCGRSDDSIERDVRSRLIVDNATSALNLTVSARDGTIRVSGVAKTRRQSERALEIAREVAGAADKVINEIRLDESPLAAAVYAAAQQDPVTAKVPFDVEVFERGIVVLRSNRTTEAQRARLLEIASKVPGVSRVDAYMK
jgi:osmotically-inducible protein OsmY